MITITPLTLADASEMAGVAFKAHSHPMSEANIATCFGPLYRVFGVYHQQSLCGFAIVHQIFEDATLIDICIVPLYQGMGYGKQLLESVIADVRAHNAEKLMLEVRASGKAARSLYKRYHFDETGVRKGYYKTEFATEDAILMELAL